MSKGTSVALVPRLRFPEFWDAGEWVRCSLSDVCDVLNNRRKPITGSNRVSGPYPYYGASGIVDYVNDFIFDERLLLIGEDGAKWGAFEKTAYIVEGKYWVNNHAHVLKPLGANDTLLENYLTMLDLGPFITGAAPPKLTLGKLKGIPLVLPQSSGEQQKIADCLASLDDLITAQTQKLDTLKTHKKGLMQQLFPAEGDHPTPSGHPSNGGEFVPKLRFPEFWDAHAWDKKFISEICRVTQGGTPDTSVASYWGGSVQWITPAEMGKGESSYVAKTVRTITEEGLKNCSSELLPENSVIISTRAPIGHLAINKLPMAINQGCRGLVPLSRSDAHFIYYYLLKSKGELNDLGSGNTFKELSGSTLKSFGIATPNTKEKQKIADCLSSLDELITLEAQKIVTLKTHKKGLMQQLFPSVGGVPQRGGVVAPSVGGVAGEA